LDAGRGAGQLGTPELSTIVGVAGIARLALNVSEMVSPAAIAPLALVVNVSVQFAVGPPVCTEPLNAGLETDVAVLIVTADARLPAVRTLLVPLLNVCAGGQPAAGLRSPLAR